MSNKLATSPLIVSTKLEEYWYEMISKEEALRRLSTQNIDEKERKKIEEEIPEETHHYLTFRDMALREYVDLGDGITHVILILPMSKKHNNTFEVPIPVHHSEKFPDGRMRHLSGIELHEYKTEDGKLVENGLARDTFVYQKGPKDVQVDVSFVVSASEQSLRPQGCAVFADGFIQDSIFIVLIGFAVFSVVEAKSN